MRTGARSTRRRCAISPRRRATPTCALLLSRRNRRESRYEQVVFFRSSDGDAQASRERPRAIEVADEDSMPEEPTPDIRRPRVPHEEQIRARREDLEPEPRERRGEALALGDHAPRGLEEGALVVCQEPGGGSLVQSTDVVGRTDALEHLGDGRGRDEETDPEPGEPELGQ